MPRPFSRLPEPWAFVRHFTPNWFAMTMGTGVLALVIAHLPWALPGQMILAEVLWLFGVALFALFALLFLTRVLLHRDTLWPMLLHPVQSMFLGAIPMGLAVLISGLVQFGPARWGDGVYALAHALWWLDAAMALGSALLVPYLMFTRQSHALEKMTAVWLLPIVAPEVAAGAAGALAPHLDPAAARLVLVVGFILWGMSLALAFSLITLVLLRLALHKLPDTDFSATSWLPLGPLATGCLGLLTMGQAAPAAFTGTPLAAAAELAHGIGLVGGLALWGAGLWWLVIATLFTRHYIRDNMAFNLGWWGFTFPLGVFALATLELLRLTELSFFAMVGLVLSVQLAAIWLLVLQRTLRGVWHGELFQAPCLGGPQSAAHGVFSAD
ncbi:TDT family transporter [Aquipseudomonas alcaligenes]|uniref:C4-dicarboxylate ABC transporter n=1 Tax=Aquipseudomonas alcaligenes TaxID=43263 RepID=A0AA37CIM9_AQUAC|nr:TDT family transporter [Pseudomonas alcaligenes]BCR22905.1 C4-dicarboxylate ABC transporter [Pseudomonas alcaligenes]GIZ67306.1 C4-dicarboxylate ABC transporter [Pseudomonas alcaligenes]GIZ70981.1 C4-dicarboxylate ABC transporter [Pseudomonas alcaligenes]GIZ75328.1 C4-dicarboxylate ABC transporter [Pseudomonas alcaligenes]GIZ80063.1 C4-dicarboxylate ABC transporter [Pseudomonas alcaligenes]